MNHAFSNKRIIDMIKIILKRSIFVLILSTSFFGCDSDPLEGYYAKDPVLAFTNNVPDTINGYIRFIQRPIKYYNKEQEIYIIAGEFNRSDGKPRPAVGNNLNVDIFSVNGELETFKLDTPPPQGYAHTDDILHYFKLLYPRVTKNISRHNGILEINSDCDTLIASYRSYWHNHLVTTTLIYNP